MKEKRKVLLYISGSIPFNAVKTGRNEPCKCGSGKKAKNCCGCDTKYKQKRKK